MANALLGGRTLRCGYGKRKRRKRAAGADHQDGRPQAGPEDGIHGPGDRRAHGGGGSARGHRTADRAAVRET